jgi:hypothetical protein
MSFASDLIRPDGFADNASCESSAYPQIAASRISTSFSFAQNKRAQLKRGGKVWQNLIRHYGCLNRFTAPTNGDSQKRTGDFTRRSLLFLSGFDADFGSGFRQRVHLITPCRILIWVFYLHVTESDW